MGGRRHEIFLAPYGHGAAVSGINYPLRGKCRRVFITLIAARCAFLRYCRSHDTSGYVLLAPLWATVQMSLAGTGIGAVLGLVGGSFASAYLNPHAWLRVPFKAVIHLIRTIPALILALLCTFLVGLGTLAGTLALSIYTTAVMARMGYEDMENADQKAAKALEAAGCGRLRAFIRTILPQDI